MLVWPLTRIPQNPARNIVKYFLKSAILNFQKKLLLKQQYRINLCTTNDICSLNILSH